jgi:hypothetical protein
MKLGLERRESSEVDTSGIVWVNGCIEYQLAS